MKYKLLWPAIALVCSIFSSHVSAESIMAFPGAKTLMVLDSDASIYRLGLGAQKRIQGSWQAENVEVHQGRLQRQTQELPEGFSVSNALELLRQHYQISDDQLLYGCSGRDCGPSNSWANNHFKVKQLYGLDGRQEYRAYKTDTGLLVFYGVRRGNKRVYSHIDILTDQPED